MGQEAALQRSLVALAAVGLWTFSYKKMAATNAFGILGIAGILLPDREFFDRSYSEWFTPMPARRWDSSHDSLREKIELIKNLNISRKATISKVVKEGLECCYK